jgi:threonine/homoserine/homoserine lactone efflux protein
MTDLLALIPPADLAAFLAAGIVLNLTPGSDVMFATACGMTGGPRAGVAAGLGVGLGGLWHVGLAVLGLGALLAAMPGALLALKWAGAAYLVWLAWSAWRAGRADLPGVEALTPARAIRQAFLVNAFNPKVALFILAFLPQFTDPARGPVWAQIAVLGSLFTLTGTLVTAGYGAGAGLFRARLADRLHIFNRIAAGLLLLLAVRLVRT